MLLLLDQLLFHLFLFIARACLRGGGDGHGTAVGSSSIAGAQVQPTPPNELIISEEIGDEWQDDSWESSRANGGVDAFEVIMTKPDAKTAVSPIRNAGVWPRANEMLGADIFNQPSPSSTEPIPAHPYNNYDSMQSTEWADEGDKTSEMREGEESSVVVIKLNTSALASIRDLNLRLMEMEEEMLGAHKFHPTSPDESVIPSHHPFINNSAEAERIECCKHLTHPDLKDCSQTGMLKKLESQMPLFTAFGFTRPYAEWSAEKKTQLSAIMARGMEAIGIEEIIQAEMCTSKGEDYTQCCADVGMTSDCLQLCNGTMTMEMWKQQDSKLFTELMATAVGPCHSQLHKMFEC